MRWAFYFSVIIWVTIKCSDKVETECVEEGVHASGKSHMAIMIGTALKEYSGSCNSVGRKEKKSEMGFSEARNWKKKECCLNLQNSS